ncbi:MAG: 2-dehydro-3-deoxygalactonokinase [Alphaproteobacteria bacterium]|nr:2-dehydro-3-deoxygalactonokinase [Alphaproteobacteria bacterium]
MTERISEKIKPDWIAVDWGTSRLRAYAMRHRAAGEGGLSAQQLCLDEIISEFGAGKIQPDQYDEKLYALIAPWLADRNTNTPLNILICGMAGARGGWCEAGYLECSDYQSIYAETALTQPKLSTKSSQFYKAWIVPGLKQSNPPDVMRGEEMQILGWMAQQAAQFAQADQIKMILPGTHSKWVTLSRHSGQKNAQADGVFAHDAAAEFFWQIDHFTTYMTGEMFHLFTEHSLLKRSLPDADAAQIPFDPHWFLRGIEMASTKGLAASLFGIRAQSLLHNETPYKLRDYLSGLLIGSEIALEINHQAAMPVAIIGDPKLAENYQLALAKFNCPSHFFDGSEMVLNGLQWIYQNLKNATN